VIDSLQLEEKIKEQIEAPLKPLIDLSKERDIYLMYHYTLLISD
jgi:hypothetical protein